MRVLTVRQPWAWAIIHGGKDVENRVRNIAGDYRGPVAIHVGLAYDLAWSSRGLDDAMQASGARRAREALPWHRDPGAIIGVVDLVGVHEAHPDCSIENEWAEPDVWHLELRNPRPLAKPIPFRGALGLRRLDNSTRTLVESELAL